MPINFGVSFSQSVKNTFVMLNEAKSRNAELSEAAPDSSVAPPFESEP
jgi:hypothetical protein